jgi:hypothetical protein
MNTLVKEFIHVFSFVPALTVLETLLFHNLSTIRTQGVVKYDIVQKLVNSHGSPMQNRLKPILAVCSLICVLVIYIFYFKLFIKHQH